MGVSLHYHVRFGTSNTCPLSEDVRCKEVSVDGSHGIFYDIVALTTYTGDARYMNAFQLLMNFI